MTDGKGLAGVRLEKRFAWGQTRETLRVGSDPRNASRGVRETLRVGSDPVFGFQRSFIWCHPRATQLFNLHKIWSIFAGRVVKSLRVRAIALWPQWRRRRATDGAIHHPKED